MERAQWGGIAVAGLGAALFVALVSTRWLVEMPQALLLFIAFAAGFVGWKYAHRTTYKLFWPFVIVWLAFTHLRLLSGERVSFGVAALAQICVSEGQQWCGRASGDQAGATPVITAMRRDIIKRRNHAAADPEHADALGELIDVTFLIASLQELEERNAAPLDLFDGYLAFFERAAGSNLRSRKDCLTIQHSIVKPDTIFLTRLTPASGVEIANVVRHPWIKGLATWNGETWAFLAVPLDAPIGTTMLPFTVSGATCEVPLRVVTGEENPLSLAAVGGRSLSERQRAEVAAAPEEAVANAAAAEAIVALDEGADAVRDEDDAVAIVVAPAPAAAPAPAPADLPGVGSGAGIGSLGSAERVPDVGADALGELEELRDGLVLNLVEQASRWSSQRLTPSPGAPISPLVDGWADREPERMAYSQRLAFLSFVSVSEMQTSGADVKAWAECVAGPLRAASASCDDGAVLAAVLLRDDSLPTAGRAVRPPPSVGAGWMEPDRDSLSWHLYRYFMVREMWISLLHLGAMLLAPTCYYLMLQRERVEGQGEIVAVQPWPPQDAASLRTVRLQHLLNLRGDLDPPVVYVAFASLFGMASASMFAPLGLDATAMRDFLGALPENTGSSLPSWIAAFSEAPPLVVGFAGYQLFAGLTFGRGLLTGTLGPETFVGLTVRGASVVLIGLAAGLGGLDAVGPAGLVAFAAGAFPMHAWMLLSRAASEQLKVTGEGSLHRLPSDPTMWQQSALSDAGVSTVNDLARADLRRLFERVGLEPRWMLRAIDEALLLDGLDISLAETLAKRGVTSATCLMAYEPAEDDELYEAVRRVRDNLLHNENYRQVHAWLRPQTPLPDHGRRTTVQRGAAAGGTPVAGAQER